ncbi:MAG TPA: homocysteine S-methyltransferase family protein [Gammaproteobacteria bacterium]|jgi:S-methylmethionine-dependent homocysteine/selenocysteine methylase
MDATRRPFGQGLRILDGGTGSELRRRGVQLSDACWSATANLSDPELLLEIHRDFIRAGADVVTANTFATSRFVLAAAGLEDSFDAINRAAISAARSAAREAGRDVEVAASLSCFPPAFDAGAYPAQDTEYRAYAELAEHCADAGVDLILLEMLQHPEHAALACRAARESGLPFWAGVSCRRRAATDELVAFDDPGQPLGAVLDAVLPFEPDGIAVMHSPVEVIPAAIAEVVQRWSGPIGAWAGIPYVEDPDCQDDRQIRPEAYATAARAWIAAGAVLVGGCCGTTPEHIRALAELRQG